MIISDKGKEWNVCDNKYAKDLTDRVLIEHIVIEVRLEVQ